MASIFQWTRKKREPYTIQYLDHQGKRLTATGFTDKGLTEELAGRLETAARLRRTGMVEPDSNQRTVDSCDRRSAFGIRSSLERQLAAICQTHESNTLVCGNVSFMQTRLLSSEIVMPKLFVPRSARCWKELG